MNYLVWSVVAMAAYSLVAPLMRLATAGTGAIPSTVAAFVSNTVLVFATLAVISVSGEGVVEHLGDPRMRYVVAAGVCLAVGIIAYYHALSLGRVSIVAPIFAMFFVASSAVGVVALDEPVTGRKLLGVGFAVVAVVLVAGE
ncbi:multidrug transporter [Halobaculum sp. CBA1158]|uniref:EamA family transporter n=1 Tax=Halobaculum sp. CBA1158 TaxID=2904243 RepID=UPI001F2CE7F8|nr:EamA family transporter [Halobaculum sp. CBA1158]UIO99071.1 multidrug transporter [Halobaculum sp. CBA1158]